MSCAEPATGPSEVADAANPTALSASLLSFCSPGSFSTFTAHWACSQTVKLYGATPFLQGNLGGPVAAWDNAISASGFATTPRFETTQFPSLATASVVGVSGGSQFCGDWSANTDTLIVKNESDPQCASSVNHGIITALLTHEMAHVWGWAGGFNTGHNGGVVGVSDHCALALPPAGGLNTTICAHNIEGGIAAYGLRSLPSQDFWSTPFVTGHNGPTSYSPVSLVAGTTQSLSLGAYQKERGDTVSGGWKVVSSDSAVATMSSSGLITAVDSGTATITISPTGGSGFFMTSAFAASSRSVQVTVIAQPLVTLVVHDIDFSSSLPITATGTYEWKAVVGTGSQAGLTYRWVFEYSDNTPPDSIFIPARQSGDTVLPWIKTAVPNTKYVGVGESQSRLVHQGSYTIMVKMWPIRNGIAGLPAAREYPVCTSAGGGGDLHGAPEDQKKGDAKAPETDVVEGCLP